MLLLLKEFLSDAAVRRCFPSGFGREVLELVMGLAPGKRTVSAILR